ncbi:Ammonium Transporter Family protein [Trichomonas vaginalis G3]|uniref:Ammonium Transporter Family protein n=1 Tax=Trichomonas vaginalis (strain ATCC PRA-98 / G3) TaxID=412133 RepID=A2G2V0_TRIV3|nr:ammonium transmembrane transporter protein [Trichomonas vaginalis G3]EAX88514.1 Ammonium Transporter Family protein [Trichomonas vaginalis G3]KAI5538210.1 ammonium transmembrane transporter protein [Trichomonas vaginalis G3]|eukprot:XP_001301444.1 Ammonium Transporter Family protein [Trichomonas vaginalis G3]
MLIVLLLSLASCNGPSEIPNDIIPEQNYTDDTIYPKVVDVWFMTILVAFFMMYIKKFEWGVMIAVLLSAATSHVTYAFVKNVCMKHDFDAKLATESVCCAITCTVTIGIFIGTIKTWQYCIVGVMFGLSYLLVEYLVVSGKAIKGVIDPGCAISIHMMAAYYGLGVACVIREKRVIGVEFKFSTHSVNWIWLGSSLLFILWPSFVSLFWKGKAAWTAAINCLMSGLGSIISAYFMEFTIKRGKVDAFVYAVALLAGCVGTSSALFMLSPWSSLLVGAICGCFSVCSFNYIHNPFTKMLGINDVMGAHNLHGICSWLSVITCAITLFIKKFPPQWTVAGAVTSFAVSSICGVITGLVLRFTKGKEIPDSDFMEDNAIFLFPHDTELDWPPKE